jgi:hypothetical protein
MMGVDDGGQQSGVTRQVNAAVIVDLAVLHHYVHFRCTKKIKLKHFLKTYEQTNWQAIALLSDNQGSG